MNTQLAIQESDLELVVSEKTLGSLTTNAKQIRDMVKAALPMYDISNYNDENIDQAKKERQGSFKQGGESPQCQTS